MKLIYLLFFVSVASHSAVKFEDAVKAILLRSQETLKSKDNIKSVDVALLSSKLSFLPEISLLAYKSKSDLDSTDIDGLKLQSNLNLWSSGRDYYQYKQMDSLLSLTKLAERDVLLKEESIAVKTLINFIQVNDNRSIFNKNVVLKRESLSVIKRRYAKGMAPENDVLKAKVDLANAEAELSDNDIYFEEIRNDVIRLLGNDKVELIWPWQSRLYGLNVRSIQQYKLNFEDRIDISMLNSKIERVNYQQKQERSKILPRVDLTVTREQTKVYSQSSWETVSTVTVTMPLFSGLKDYSSFYSKKIEGISLERDKITAKKVATRDFDSAKSALEKGIFMSKKRKENLKTSRKVYIGNFKRFKKGLASINELQLDQMRLLNSEKLNSSGQKQLHIAFVTFCHSIGKSVFSCQLK